MTDVPNPALPDDTAGFIALIRAQGGTEAAEAVAEAERTAQRIGAEADTELKSIREAAQREGRERGRRTQAKILAESEASLHRERLWAREHLLQATLQTAQQRLRDLCALPGAAAILARLIREAVEQLPDGRVRLSMPAEYLALLDAQHVAGIAGQRWQIEITTQDPPAGGGVIASTADDGLRYDNSFTERLRRIEDAARSAAHTALLGDWREPL